VQHPVEPRHVEIAAGPLGRRAEPAGAREQETLGRHRRALAAQNLPELAPDDRGRPEPEQLADTLVGCLDTAVGTHEEHAVGGRLEDLGELNPLGLRLGVEARVLERDGRLVREGLQQAHLVVGELAHRAIAEREHADRSRADRDRHAQDGAVSGGLHPRALCPR
jgi:hypothetical protein